MQEHLDPFASRALAKLFGSGKGLDILTHEFEILPEV
jgi:hypothetical protein